MLNRLADAVLQRLVPRETADAAQCVIVCRCQGGAQADASCVSRIGYYCALVCPDGTGPWTFNGCC